MLYNIDFNSDGLPKSLVLKKDEVYTFREVTPEELFEIRIDTHRGVVYKKYNRLFYARVERNVNFYQKGVLHMCGENCSNICKSCPRARDLTVPYQLKNISNRKLAVMHSWRIEKYDFILEGAESFNMTHDKDSCLVIKCTDYQTKKVQPIFSKRDIEKKKAKLAAYHFEDFTGETPEDFYAWRHSQLFKSFEL